MELENKIANQLIKAENSVLKFIDWYVANTNQMTRELIALSDMLISISENIKTDNFLNYKVSPTIYPNLQELFSQLKLVTTKAEYNRMTRNLNKSKVEVDNLIKSLVAIIVYTNVLDKSSDIANEMYKPYQLGYSAMESAQLDIAEIPTPMTGVDDRTLDKTIKDNIGFIIAMGYLETRRLVLLKNREYKLLTKKVHLFQNRIKANLISANNYMFNQGIVDRMRKVGIEKYKFSAILDNKTSDICRGLNGKVYLVSEAEVGINLAPMHRHCRSIAIPLVD